MAPPRNVPNKFDAAEQHRGEIEQRTAQGETCEQIAAALRAKGVDITNKTISRRRIDWGLRKRSGPKLTGTKARPTKSRPKPPPQPNSRAGKINARKAEIEARTRRGATAAQIASALEAQGYVLKKGESTILRLQTTWGLISSDKDRARGRKRKAASNPSEPPTPKISKRDREREANREQQTQTMHYPSNCFFGPRKRVDGVIVEADNGQDIDLPSAAQLRSVFPATGDSDSPQALLDSGKPTVNVAAEIMSVEFLVDLANSTLGAATQLKDMLLAYQAGQPAPNAKSSFPPTLEDLATARRKVREAAAVMHDLAAEPVVADAPP